MRILINKKHHDAVEKASQARGLGYGLLFLCFGCLLAAVGSNPSLGAWPLVVFVAIAIVYYVVAQAGFYNEIEGAIACGIMLLALFILLQAYAAHRQMHHPPLHSEIGKKE